LTAGLITTALVELVGAQRMHEIVDKCAAHGAGSEFN
jgi:hypothetical protein